MSRTLRALAIAAMALVTTTAAVAAPAPATTQSSDPTLQVYSVRIGRGRNNSDMQKRFAGRFYNETQAGVVLSLLMTLNDDSVFLAPTREAINIETFVDDTYENLLGGPNENRYSGQNPVVSIDGKQIMLTLGSSRPPTDDAGRVFVRGSLQTRVSRGAPIVSTGTMSLKAGAQVEVGPFKTALRSISDNGQSVSLQLAVTGDAGRIRQVRILGKDGRQLNNDNQNRSFQQDSGPEQPATYHANIPPAQDEVTIEFTHVEKAEDVKIPFEAQVDLGVTKAGPATTVEPKPAAPSDRGGAATPRPRASGNVRERPWPPPPVGTGVAGAVEFPRRRAAFDPSAASAATQPSAEKIKLNNTAVDIFALTIAKPRPDENKDVKWNNPPAAQFRAAGYTVARLMLSTPDASILAVAPDGIEISRFEDDKIGKLDTTVYSQGYNYASGFGGSGRGNVAFVSPDGQQALLNVSMVAAPTPGATKCTLGGTVKARVARGDRTDSSEPVALEQDRNIKVGPAEIRIAYVRQQPITTPGFSGRPAYELALQIGGKIDKLRSIELINPTTGVAFANSLAPTNFGDLRDTPNPMPLNFGFAEPPPEKVIVRVRHFAEAEVVSVPFEVTTGIGL